VTPIHPIFMDYSSSSKGSLTGKNAAVSFTFGVTGKAIVADRVPNVKLNDPVAYAFGPSNQAITLLNVKSATNPSFKFGSRIQRPRSNYFFMYVRNFTSGNYVFSKDYKIQVRSQNPRARVQVTAPTKNKGWILTVHNKSPVPFTGIVSIAPNKDDDSMNPIHWEGRALNRVTAKLDFTIAVCGGSH